MSAMAGDADNDWCCSPISINEYAPSLKRLIGFRRARREAVFLFALIDRGAGR